MFENPRKSRQARNFTTNVPKILDLKSSSEQIFFRKLSLGAPDGTLRFLYLSHPLYGICVKIFIMNRYTTQRARILLTDNIKSGAAVVSTVTSNMLGREPYLLQNGKNQFCCN